MARLEAAIDLLTRNQPPEHLFITGPAGVGKSSIVAADLADYAADTRVSTATINCWQYNTRAALLTELLTKHGRPTGSNLRQNINAFTRPCHYSGDCPHGREIKKCEASDYDKAQRCPSSVSPHAIRRSVITEWLNKGHQKELLSDRMNVGTKTLDKHYDARTKKEKRELRKEEFGMDH